MIDIECLFAEGSAKSGEGVEQGFGKITQTIIYKLESGEIPEESLSTGNRPGKAGAGSSNLRPTAATPAAAGSSCGGYCQIF